MPKKVHVLQQNVLFCNASSFIWRSSNESLIWVNILVEDTIDNTVEGIFRDATQFYIYEHLYVIIQYAYKYGSSVLFNNK